MELIGLMYRNFDLAWLESQDEQLLRDILIFHVASEQIARISK
jgi:hypothetical protein